MAVARVWTLGSLALITLVACSVFRPAEVTPPDRGSARKTEPAPPPEDTGPSATTAEPGPPMATTPEPAKTTPAPAPKDDPLLPPAPDDPIAALYAKRLEFRGGAPRLPIRLMEGATDVRFSPRGRMKLKLTGGVEKTLDAPAGSKWRVRVHESTPAKVETWVQLAEFPFADKKGLAAAQREWKAKQIDTRVHILGALYGIAGKVIDNRRYLLLFDERMKPADAAAKQGELLREHGARTSLLEELVSPPRGILELLDAEGASVGLAQDRMIAETEASAGFDVARVEYGVGYDFHNFEDRSYRGALQLALDRTGKIAVVNLVPLEALLYGLVPSEIFARAPAEALKAQAVTARGEVLAKIGQKHLADPYLLCSEQHCAVYKGLSGEHPATNAAVNATRGLGLFSREGRLVDSVYSAVCGGHTEDNDIVWGGPPNPSLRGRPDLLPGAAKGPSPKKLEAFLASDAPAMCRVSSFAQPSKYRWEKRFTAEDVNARTDSLGVGAVHAMEITERGVSGRGRVLSISGENGATQIRGELNIRRLFGMLNSAMVLISNERDESGAITHWVFRGGGWGHGVGMCQTGAIGRAEAGQTFQEILRHYYNGAEAAAIY